MVIDLRNRITVAIQAGGTGAICRQNTLVDLNIMLLNPGHEGWPDIKAEVLVIIDDIDDPPLTIKHTGKGIGAIALG